MAKNDPELQRIVEGLISRQASLIQLDPYANAYRLEELKTYAKREFSDNCKLIENYKSLGPNDRRDGKTEKIWERKYEVDSLAYFLSLSYKYWQETGSRTIFDDNWLRSAKLIVSTWVKEQRHDPATSPYKTHSELFGGQGRPTKYTGMTWSGTSTKCRNKINRLTYFFLLPPHYNLHRFPSLRRCLPLQLSHPVQHVCSCCLEAACKDS
jgi:uncharacterized protein